MEFDSVFNSKAADFLPWCFHDFFKIFFFSAETLCRHLTLPNFLRSEVETIIQLQTLLLQDQIMVRDEMFCSTSFKSGSWLALCNFVI